MPCILTFTCVPMGRNEKDQPGPRTAQLDVLVVPNCDDKSQIAELMSWGATMIACADKFKLAQAGGPSLKLQTDGIQPGLWAELFGDANVDSPGTRTRHTPITPHGVSLSHTHSLAKAFHELAQSRVIDPKKHSLDRSFLTTLHQKAIDDHGFYMKDVSGAPIVGPSPQDPIAQDILRTAESTAQEPDAHLASSLIRERLGINAPIYDHNSKTVLPNSVKSGNTMVRPPYKAAHALTHLKVHMTNSLRAAGQPSQPMLASTPRPQHLLFHVNRLVATASHRKSSGAKKIAENVLLRKPYSFNERITMLLNMPALLEALGLVLHFEVPWSSQLAPGPVALQLDLAKNPDMKALSRYGTLVSRTTLCNNQFLPQPKPRPGLATTAIRDNGWIEPADGYQAGSLQLDSAAMQITQFANQAALRQLHSENAEIPVSASYDEDVKHPLLPPSPHTGGLQVWQDDLQARVVEHRKTAVQNSSDPNLPLYADDLKNGVVVDILPVQPDHQPGCEDKAGGHSAKTAGLEDDCAKAKWIHLCLRDEEFRVNGITVQAKHVERSVKTAAARSIDPSATAPLSHDVDETIFTWRLGSLVAKSPLVTNGIQSGTKMVQGSEAQRLPWHDKEPPRIKASDPVPSPRFGWNYRVAMRAAFVTGSVVPFDPCTADRCTLPQQTFQRYELIQGPVLIPVLITNRYLEDQSPTMMFVGSKIKDDLTRQPFSELSQRVIVPAQVTPDVARRHGRSEDSIAKGTTVLPLTNGSLPHKVIRPASPATPSSGVYLPDPLCTGVWAILTKLDGTEIAKKSLDFYNDKDGIAWPDYAPHMIELQASDRSEASIDTGAITSAPGAFPFLQRSSRAFICRVPPGQTFLLVLRPKLHCSVTTAHALSNATTAKDKDGKLNLELLALSDVCRPTVVRMTHATDRPIVKPGATTVPAAQAGIVTVKDVSTLKIGATADRATTSKVALRASWQETTDDLNRAAPTTQKIETQLAEFNISKDPKKDQVTEAKAQFPFSDGRYRQLTMTPRGTGRYGDVFGKDDKDKQKRMLNGDPVQMDLLATHAPKMPDVEYLLPNIRWNLKEKRTRTMGLTLVLNRPWYTSGTGEQLAVITAAVTKPDDPVVGSISTNLSPNAEEHVSAWGVLEDWVSFLPKGAAGQSISLIPDKTTGTSNAPGDVPVPRNIKINGSYYSALCYTPRYNQQDQQWYVNLLLSAPPAYGAVVRLLTARYQEHALDGMQVSDPAMCDFALLRPQRSVNITKKWGPTGRKMQVQILGLGPSSPADPKAASVPRTMIEVRHFERDPNKAHTFDWTAGDIVQPDEKPPQSPNVLWQGTFPYPWLGGELVAQEWEIWPTAEDPQKTNALPVYFDIFPI